MRGSERGFNARVAGADDDDVVFVDEIGHDGLFNIEPIIDIAQFIFDSAQAKFLAEDLGGLPIA